MRSMSQGNHAECKGKDAASEVPGPRFLRELTGIDVHAKLNPQRYIRTLQIEGFSIFMGELNNRENPVRVLVIEDNPDDRELLLHQLRRGNMADHVKFISDGKEALDFLIGPTDAALAAEIVAIFLDLKLPSIGGLDLLRSLRKSVAWQNVPVIVMTSSNNPKDIDECRQLKVTNYVSKPVTFNSFSKAVADVFHRPKTNTDTE